MKGTIRERANRDGTTSYLCQVLVGRDPVTQRRLFKTAVAKSRREAHSLIPPKSRLNPALHDQRGTPLSTYGALAFGVPPTIAH